MHFLSVVLIFISTIRSQQLSSTFTLTHQGSAFQPPNSVELLLTSNVPKLVSCSMACFAHFYCRVFDYDTTSKRCRLFESMLSTGTMISSSSVVGEMHLTPENYFFFNHTGDHCQNSRYLMVNASSNRCVCPKHTFWNASLCLNQVYEGSACVADEWCRADFDLMCRQTMPRICISRNSTTVIDLTSVVPTATSSAIPLTINFNQTYPAPVNSSNAAAGCESVSRISSLTLLFD